MDSRAKKDVTAWIDVSMPIDDEMVHWPGNPEVKISYAKNQAKGDEFAVSRLNFGSHVGTHVDAPRHFFEDGAPVSDWRAELTVGPALVLGVPEDVTAIDENWLKTQSVPDGSRVLFKTKNSRLWQSKNDDEFHRNYVALSASGARWLRDRTPLCIGVDYLSVGPKNQEINTEVHKTLLGAGIWIIEGLDLSKVEPGNYELLCLPLRLEGRDGSPARALLKKAA